jgi:putative ABC transport system permease protein
LAEHLAGRLRLVVVVLMGAVFFVLLIACANVGSLQLVRAAGRMRELAVRAALGAGRARVARQLLVESAVLAVLGGAVGLWLGSVTLGLIARWGPTQQSLEGVHLDGRAIAFTALVATAAAIAFGTLPALRAFRVDLQSVTREVSRGVAGSVGGSRLLGGSVVVQIGLALVLLIGTGLMVRSLERLLGTDVGFAPERVVSAQVALPLATYDSVAKQRAFYDAVLERLRSMPGIDAASVVWALPFSDQVRDSSPFEIVGRPMEPGGPERHAEYRVVGGDYFKTMAIPLLRGRTFDSRDDSLDPTGRAVLIDEHFARQFFPGEDPVGRQIVHARGPATIVGVVGRVHHGQIGEPRKALSYYHYRQTFSREMAITVRPGLDSAAASAMVRTSVHDVDPNLPLYDVATMEQRVRRSLGDRRLAIAALGGFGGLSILLAMLGTYGVMRYSTSHRTQEIGIRMALGATRGAVVAMVVREGMTMAGLGVLLGVGAALALTRMMEGMLFGIAARDPITFVVVSATVLLVSLPAALLPARRAARVEPVVALRSE